MGSRAFRFHLSTAVLMMIAAGGLIGLNLNRRFLWKELPGIDKRAKPLVDEFELSEVCYGFPISAWQRSYFLMQKNENAPEVMAELIVLGESDNLVIKGKGVFRPMSVPSWSGWGVATDILFGLTSLFLIWLISEYFVRRKLSRPSSADQEAPKSANTL